MAGPGESGGSEIVLEPAEDDSSIVLSASGSDVLSLDELEKEEDSGGTAGTAAPGAAKGDAEKKKGDTVVSSVGISVFDDDDSTRSSIRWPRPPSATSPDSASRASGADRASSI